MPRCTYTAISAEGKELRSLDNRITLALRRVGNEWKIFHEHTSGPIDHKTMKGTIKRGGSLMTAAAGSSYEDRINQSPGEQSARRG